MGASVSASAAAMATPFFCVVCAYCPPVHRVRSTHVAGISDRLNTFFGAFPTLTTDHWALGQCAGNWVTPQLPRSRGYLLFLPA